MATVDLDNDGVDDSVKSRRQQQLDKATLVPTEIQKLDPDAIVELFELDMSNLKDSQGNPMNSCYFHAGTNQISQPVIWRGKTYMALPIEAEGFEATTQGTLPRPKFRLANLKGLFSAGVRELDDFVGCKVIRRRTFAKFLDPNNFDKVGKDALGQWRHLYYTDDRVVNWDSSGVIAEDHNIYIDPDQWASATLSGADNEQMYTNFKYKDAGGTVQTISVPSPYRWNPTYDPNQHYPDEVWYVEQKVSETKWLIEWELSSPLDLHGVQLPRRQVIQNTCCWKYCSPECGWSPLRASTQRYYDKNNKSCALAQDMCSKRLSSCEIRFAGTGRSIPFGGFPGAVRYNQ